MKQKPKRSGTKFPAPLETLQRALRRLYRSQGFCGNNQTKIIRQTII